MAEYLKRTEKEISRIALGIYKGDIFTSAQIRKNDDGLLCQIFMPLLFLSEDGKNEMKDHNAVLFYADVSEALPTSINGYPIFMSMFYLNNEDNDRLWKKYDSIKNAIDGEIEKVPEGQMEIDFDNQ